MTTTVRDVLEMGLRKLGVIDPTADEIGAALQSLNMMFSGWKLQGIDIWHTAESIGNGFPVVELDGDPVTAGDALPMPDAFAEATAYCLAEKLAPEYGKQMDATRYLRMIQAGYAIDNKTVMDPILFYSNARRRPRWIY